MISGYGWRKYDCGVALHRYQPKDLLEDHHQLILWPAAVAGQHPGLNRWAGLGPALIGFVSHGLAAPHACAYSATQALELIGTTILSRTWMQAPDAADAYEYLLSNLMGVWMGEKTPYFVTPSAELEEILKSSR